MLLEKWGATDEEAAGPMPGDSLVSRPAFSATRSISLASNPEIVFGWLTQMGWGKAGWYSYDLLDNGGRRSARTLNPQWQVHAAGAKVPAGPIEFLVAEFCAPHHFVLVGEDLGGLGHDIEFSLAYRLEAQDHGTRLITRARGSVEGPLGTPLGWMLGTGDGFMVRRQLLGLRQRC